MSQAKQTDLQRQTAAAAGAVEARQGGGARRGAAAAGVGGGDAGVGADRCAVGRRVRDRVQRREQQRHPGCRRDRASPTSRWSCAARATDPTRSRPTPVPTALLLRSRIHRVRPPIAVLIPTGHAGRRRPNVGDDDAPTATASRTATGYSVATVITGDGTSRPISGSSRTRRVDPEPARPGTGRTIPRPGPSTNITVGGVMYTKAQAIAWLSKVGQGQDARRCSARWCRRC